MQASTPVTMPRRSTGSCTPVVLLPSSAAFPPSSFPFHAPANPSAARFAGWLSSNGAPIDGVSQTVDLQQLSGNYSRTLDDHCYADYKTEVPTVAQTVDVTSNSK